MSKRVDPVNSVLPADTTKKPRRAPTAEPPTTTTAAPETPAKQRATAAVISPDPKTQGAASSTSGAALKTFSEEDRAAWEAKVKTAAKNTVPEVPAGKASVNFDGPILFKVKIINDKGTTISGSVTDSNGKTLGVSFTSSQVAPIDACRLC